jgi:site-specific DNA recombinase
MTRTCLYTRISTDEENQPTSLASQHERLEAFCKVQEDWRIIAHHEDRATGTKLERPGLQAALDLARQGRIDQLLVYRIDRLSRKVRQLAGIAEELDNLGVILRSATEPFDTGSAAGRMMLQMLGVFAEFEHATIVDRVTSGIERRAREGRWPNGRIPFGYARNERKELVPDERTAPVIRRIFKWYAAGRLGAAAIARRLDAEHAPAPPRGWQPAVVLWILANEAYVGRVHWREQTFPGIHEPLTDQDTFDRAQALLKERGEDMTHRAARAEFLLSGLLRCGRCRRAYVGMSAKGNGGTYHYYACSGRQKLGRKSCDGERLPKDKLETAILDQLTGLYRHGGLIRDAIEQAAESNDNNRAQLAEQRASLAKEITRAERAIERYQDAFENGDLDPARFKERLSALDTRLDALQAQDQALARELAAEAPTTPDTAALHAVADQLAHVIAHGDIDQTKALLRILIADLRVNSRREVLPTYRVGAPVVCAQTSSVDAGGRRLNRRARVEALRRALVDNR